MLETQKMVPLLNPWAFHLQKLGLELKCPLCLNLLDKPILLPCNHIFCKFCIPKSNQFGSECPACQNHYTDRERRPTPFMENIVAVYRSLDATFNATISPLFSSDAGKSGNSPVSVLTSDINLRRKPNEAAHREGNKKSNASFINCVLNGTDSSERTDKSVQLSDGSNGEFEKQGGCDMLFKVGNQVSPLQSTDWNDKMNSVEELDVNQVLEFSPGGSPSFSDAKDADVCTDDIGSRNGESFLTREAKRQKKLSYGLSGEVLRRTGYSQIIPHNLAVSDCNEEPKFKENSTVIPPPAIFDASDVNGNVCAFCLSSKITDGTGPMLHYADGKEVTGSLITVSRAIPVHSKCIEWSPQVYYAGETIKNLEPELARAAKLKCSRCGLKGAALGCFAKSCRRSYHVPCAVEIPGCRWDCDDFLMLCPVHKSTKFPSEKSHSKKQKHGEHYSASARISSVKLNFWATSPNGPKELVFCGSSLSSKEKHLLFKFATLCGGTVSKSWSPDVTHVIAATDEKGAFSRTLKVLMAILNGRWILTIDWLKACMEANRPVNEEPYEVNMDNHGCCDGPKNGRLRASTNAPKLFDGFQFYFSGDFVPAYKNDLLELVTVGGGTIIENMEQMIAERHNEQAISTLLVVYNQDSPQGCLAEEASSSLLQRFEDANNLATKIGSLVIPHTWILETIAACRLLPSPSDQAV
ncbi:BRCA1-associated RING domain protein 1-like isoform X1 [Olea europaea var. sylvestris]|uniref:BRCA1-associated RING domain protein 1-like isoform X1 n=1 Tax=Olea europaea var. sylvestris TaxID=158386 RepID=UPI000C1D4516|nr:BRCA1-associated RING domain protein 1-like isoform X1 [Olea europaea var. sylvestris]